ncbi:MAG TPA: radical SAM protein [Candidatus Magasanikbacteria bacterium]|nr:radical SAM protein [Candidatus Magasanikbacteria bacterium]
MNKIRVSLGSAAILGLRELKMTALSQTIYLMNSGGCEFNCSFCAQAKCATSEQDKLSRVSWPEYDLDIVLQALKEKQNNYKRICFQVVNSPRIFKTLAETTKKIRESTPHSQIAITIRTYKPEDIEAVFNAGADEVGLSIDAVNEEQFAKIKGGNLKIYQDFILHTADKYPGKIATHLIVGMGETEKEMVDMIQELHEHEVIIALFAFTPVKGAKLEFKQEPNISSYRRIQVALYLVRNNLDKSFVYNDNGQITNFGYNKEELVNILKDSNVFETSGCKDCNRPYYNERVGDKDLYNYPCKVADDKFVQILESIYEF